MKKRTLLIIGAVVVAVIVLSCVGCYIFGAINRSSPTYKATATAQAIAEATEAARPTDTPAPPSPPTEAPTPTLALLTCEDIEKKHKELTDLQWDVYRQEIIGERIRFAGKVLEVYDDGRVHIKEGKGLLTGCMLHEVPRDMAITLAKDQLIQGEGSVREVDTLLGLTVSINFDSLQSPTETTIPTDALAPSQLTAKVTAPALNVRAGPGTAYPIVGKLSLDDLVEVVGKNTASDWLQIVYPADSSGRAWIAVAYADLTGSLTMVPEVSAPPTPAASPTPKSTATPELTPTSNWAGATKWLVQKEQKVGVTQVRFDHRIDKSYGYYEADPGNVFLSLWIVGEHFQGDGTETFNPLDFGVADAAGRLHGHLIMPQLEPTFELCTVFVGAKCEGWLTFEVADPQGAKGQLKFVWQPSWFDERQMTEIEY